RAVGPCCSLKRSRPQPQRHSGEPRICRSKSSASSKLAALKGVGAPQRAQTKRQSREKLARSSRPASCLRAGGGEARSPPPTEALPNSRLKKRIAPPSIALAPATVEPKRNREASRCRCGARGLPMLRLGGHRLGKADKAPGEGHD